MKTSDKITNVWIEQKKERAKGKAKLAYFLGIAGVFLAYMVGR